MNKLMKTIGFVSQWIVWLKKIQTKKRYLWLGLLSFIIVACNQGQQAEIKPTLPTPTANSSLSIWWEKGFNLEEDEALQKVVDDWQKKSNHQAQLSFYTTDDLAQKAQRALQAGHPPDILMSHNAERALYPHLAWQGRLVDVSDIIKPVQEMYPASILEAVNFYNQVEKKRSYYAVPFSQSTNFISYWRDLIEQAGYQEKDIPHSWYEFWNFWKKVQDQLNKQGNKAQNSKIYGLGFSFSDKAADTYLFFEQVLEAYNVQLLTRDGKLHINDLGVRQSIIDSLKWYTEFYQQGYVPQETIKWLNPDNNSYLLNRSIVMTPNTSLTIPATVRQDTEVYNHQLRTLGFPNKVNGQPTRHILTIKQAVIFQDSQHQALAKDFLAYFIQPEVIGDYLKAAGIRNMPIAKTLWSDPYWNNVEDPHISIGAKVLRSEYTRPFPSVYHPAYSLVTQENVWGNAIHRIVVEQISPEMAADDAIARINEIFQQW